MILSQKLLLQGRIQVFWVRGSNGSFEPPEPPLDPPLYLQSSKGRNSKSINTRVMFLELCTSPNV